MAVSQKKTFFYNFFPTKEEEEAQAEKPSLIGGRQISKNLIEINDIPDYQAPPPLLSRDPRRIIKTVVSQEIMMGVLFLSFKDIFEHVFRYWPMDEIKAVEIGYNIPVKVGVVPPHDHQSPIVVYSEKLHKWQTEDYYILGCIDLIRGRCIQAGDEIGLAWHSQERMFLLKVLSRGKSVMLD